MLAYEQFEKYMTAIVSADEKADEVCNVLGCSDKLFECTAIGTAIELLSWVMGDSEEWIAYWMYEQEYGTKWDENTASYKDGTPVICKTIRQLYDFLVKNAKR